MDFLLARHAPDLAPWSGRPFSAGAERGPGPWDMRLAFGREVGLEAPGPPADGGPFRRIAEAIFRYDVFPPELIRGVLARTPVEEGDTVGIEYRRIPGVRLFFAARVIERFDAEDGSMFRAGFTYRTLLGHPELGEETFAALKDAKSGAVRVSLDSWSRPGHRLTRLAEPWMRRLQRQGNEAALDHLARIAAGGTAARSCA